MSANTNRARTITKRLRRAPADQGPSFEQLRATRSDFQQRIASTLNSLPGPPIRAVPAGEPAEAEAEAEAAK